MIVWPFSRAGTLPIPETFNQAALQAAGAVTGQAPLILGFAGAIPIMALRRRLLSRPLGGLG